MTTTTDLRDSIARSLFILALADWADSDRDSTTYPYSRAHGSEDWFEVLSDIPTDPAATRKADAILADWSKTCPDPVAVAEHWCSLTGQDLDRFGFCLVCVALGHGVGLQDDIPSGVDFEDPDVRYWEFYYGELDGFITPAPEPEDGDYLISDGGGGHGYVVSIHDGRYVGSVATRDEADAMIRLHAGPNYWPNVWILSDHGNAHLVDTFDWTARP